MTDKPDIVERLRDYSGWLAPETVAPTLMREAADEIERLRRRTVEDAWDAFEADCNNHAERVAHALLSLAARERELKAVLKRARTVLDNMTRETPRVRFAVPLAARWAINHEPLRSDAKRLLPDIDRALSKGEK